MSLLFSEYSPDKLADTMQVTLATKRAKGRFSWNKTLAVQVIVAVVFVGGLLLIDRLNRNSATLTLRIENNERVFTGEVVPHMTVLDALNASVRAGNIPFRFAIDRNKTTILMFSGITRANISDRFIFFLNERKVDTDIINQVPVRSDDEIVVRFSSNEK